MSLFPVRFKRDTILGGSYDYRSKAPGLWGNQLENEATIDMAAGYRDRFDFSGCTTVANGGTVGSDWLVTHFGAPGTAVTATQRASKYGVARIGTAATGAVARGGQLLRFGVGGPVVMDQTNKATFETSLDNLLAASGVCAPNFFTGLYAPVANTDAILTTAAAMGTTRAYCGFARLGSAAGVLGDLVFVSGTDAAGTTGSVVVLTAAQVATLVAANTKINLGFSVQNRDKIELYVNGDYQRTASESITATNRTAAIVPVSTVGLVPAWASLDYITSGSVGTVSMDADWYEVYCS